MLAPGESAPIVPGLNVRFVTVENDSRCPADALCILGGDAIVRIEILTSHTTVPRELHTGNNQPVTFDGLRIELVELAPYPFSAHPIQPEDYRAMLRVTARD